MKLLKITIFVFVSLSLSSFSEKAEKETKTAKTHFVVDAEDIYLEGRVCRTVSTTCGGGSRSTNTACMHYDGPDGRQGAYYAAYKSAQAMGNAACATLAALEEATVVISPNSN